MQEIIMPKLGLTMEEGTLVRWHKREGEAVEKGEILFEVETDKAVNEVEASLSGTLGKILIGEGETAAVLEVIAYLLEPGEAPPERWPTPAVAPAEKTRDEAAAPARQAQATPVARRLAHERGIDLSQIQGTGEGGTITKEDVLGFEPIKERASPSRRGEVIASPRAKRLAAEKGIALERIRGSGPGGRITEKDVTDFVERENLITPSRIQQITAERLTESFTTVPHFYLRVEADASELVAWRAKLLPQIEASTGVRLTYTDLLILLVARKLTKHPRLNASWEGGLIRQVKEIHLGVATAVEEGLLVPVIKNADRKGLAEIAQERKRLAQKAQAGKLGLADLEGGSFTLTNLGMFGVDDFDAIINPPQSAVLAVGRIAERVVAEEGQAVVKPTLRLSLAMDHRVLDGAVAARFLVDLKDVIEAPDSIFAGLS
jgi:pyruvate dehydrogenase E2 component (dihydrolipoamide acetyltransferase)